MSIFNNVTKPVLSFIDGSFVDWNCLYGINDITRIETKKIISGIDDSEDEDDEPPIYRVNGPIRIFTEETFYSVISLHFLKRSVNIYSENSREEQFRIFINRVGDKIGNEREKDKWKSIITKIIDGNYLNQRIPNTNRLIRYGNIIIH